MKEVPKIKWPKVAVVIVNWNGGRFLDRCLSALVAQTVQPHDIILVDNASSDASSEIVRRFPSVRLLAQKENLGFTRGNNLAVAAAFPESEWIAFLNPDAFPDQRWLEELLSAARENPAFEVFGSRLLSAAKPAALDGMGDVYHVSGLVWRQGHGKTADAAAHHGREIFSPCAAAALYSKKAFLEANGFDEDYFCYVEDVDLGFRIRLLGYRCLYVPNAVVHHMGSATTGGRHSDFAVYHGHRNLVWTYVKNMPNPLFWLLLPLHVLLNIVSIVWFLILGKGLLILQAKTEACKGLPRMWKKRRIIQKHRRVSAGNIWMMLEKSLLPRLNRRWW